MKRKWYAEPFEVGELFAVDWNALNTSCNLRGEVVKIRRMDIKGRCTERLTLHLNFDDRKVFKLYI